MLTLEKTFEGNLTFLDLSKLHQVLSTVAKFYVSNTSSNYQKTVKKENSLNQKIGRYIFSKYYEFAK